MQGFAYVRLTPNTKSKWSSRQLWLGLIFAAGIMALWAWGGGVPLIQTGEATIHQLSKAQLLDAFERLPLTFVANAGQINEKVIFSSQGPNSAIFFTRDQVALSLTRAITPQQPNQYVNEATPKIAAHEKKADELAGMAISLQFLDANREVEIEGRAPKKSRFSYFVGNDPDRWRTELPSFGEVYYKDLWPGVDLRFHGHTGVLKYDFIVAAGVRPDQIGLTVNGAEGLSLDEAGNLVIETPLGIIRDGRPLAFQEIGGRKVPVEMHFTLTASDKHPIRVGYRVESDLDRKYPLIIDPGLFYSTYLGGSGKDAGSGIAVDTAGNAYISGITASVDFPTTFGPAFNGVRDMFVAKLDPQGDLVWSTLIGGSGDDEASYVAVEADGTVTIGGSSSGDDFPITENAFDRIYNGGSTDGVVVQLDNSGLAHYSTYLGGAGEDFIRNVDVEDGKIYVDGGVGFSGPPSADPDNPDGSFPTTESAFEREFRGGSSDIMIAVIDPDTAGPNGLMYSTLLGGSGWDIGHGLDARDGFIYVTGRCQSPDLQTGPTGVVQPDFAGGLEDAFVSKWDPTKSGDASRIYVTFLGGSLFDNGLEVRADADGSAFVTGITSSSDYPTTAGAFQETFGGGFADVYVTKLNADGTQILYSTYIGGGATEMPLGLALNDKSQVAVTGKVQGDDYPTTPGAFLETSPTPNVPFDLSGSTNSLRFAFGTEGYTVSVGSGALDPDFGPEVTFSGDPSLPFPIDDDYATISLAGFFTFPFQDQVYATIFVNSDGNITFGEPDPASTPRDTKRLVSGSPRIAPYLIDVAFLGRGSGTVHAKVLANQAVVTYSGVMDGNTIQVTLYSSGNIEIVYGTVKTPPNVVGISEGNNKGPFLETDLSAADGTLIGRTIFEEFGTNQQYIIAMLNSTGSDLIYSTFLGGDGPTTWGPVAVDADSNLYVTSFNTSSANFPVTPNAFDETYNGDSDTFVAKLATTPQAWIETIIQEVGGLREHGVINRRQKVALVVELELARAGIDAGRPDVATERLNAFAKTVDRLVDNGVLSTAQGESLDDLGSEKVIRQVEYLVAIGEIETDDDD